MRKCKKESPKFLCAVTERMLDIHLHVFHPPPLIAGINFRTWSRHACHK